MGFLDFIPKAIQGAIGSTALDLFSKKKEQIWSKQAAGRQMDFQERMSSTAYQRAMADMRKAGINPIMVAKLGGASTPTGAIAKTPDMGKPGSDILEKSLRDISTAQQLKFQRSQTENMKQQTRKLIAETKTIEDRNKYEIGSYEGMIKKAELKNIQLQGDLLRQNISATRLKNEMQTFENNWFINQYGAPSATLTAKVQNYVLSKAFTKMSKKDEDALIKQIHKATNFVTNNAQVVLDNPEILYTMFGAYAASFVTDAVVNKIKSLIPFYKGGKGAKGGK